jgi:uncharacterized membrane protein
MKHKFIYQILTEEQLHLLAGKIGEMEKNTSGEIRLSIKKNKPFFKSNKPISELAKEEFFRLGMDKTRDKTGILLFLILAHRQFHILADSGINEKVTQATWDKIRDSMQDNFRDRRFFDGLIAGIEQVGKVLNEHFPIKSDDTNELSNDVVF